MDEDLKKLRKKLSPLIEQKKWGELIAESTKLIHQAINLEQRTELYTYRGNAYFQNGEDDKALSDLSEAVRQSPNNECTYYNRGNIYLQKSEYDKAIDDYSKAISLGFDEASVYSGRGNAYSEKGKSDEAINDFIEVIRRSPNDKYAYYNLGFEFFGKKEYAQAIHFYNEAIKRGLDEAIVYVNRGNAYFRKGELDRALSDYNIAKELPPKDSGIYCNLGVVYLHKGEYAQAIANYDTAIALDSSEVFAYNGRGNVYNEIGEYDKALADYEKAIECNPNDVTAHINQAVIFNKQGEFDKALAVYNKLIDHIYDRNDSSYAIVYNRRAAIYNQKNQYNKALNDYDKAIRLAPEDAYSYSDRGLLHHKFCSITYSNGDYQKAEYLFKKAREDFQIAEAKGVLSISALAAKHVMEEIKDFSEKEKEQIYMLHEKVLAIREILYCKIDSWPISHYCSLDTLRALTQGSQLGLNNFRLYNVDYMDDPEEGRVFFNKLNESLAEDDWIENLLYKNAQGHEPISQEYVSPAYIGSFSRKHEEDLFLWRTYGKQDGVDAAGACLFFKASAFSDYVSAPFSTSIFSASHFSGQYQMTSSLINSESRGLMPESGAFASMLSYKPPLFKVVYESDIEKNQGLKDSLRELVTALKGLDGVGKTYDLARELLDGIRFLFKSDHYRGEEEARVIVMHYWGSGVDNYVKVDNGIFPPKFYVEPFKGNVLEKVILGPQVKRGISEWKEIVKRSESLKGVEIVKSGIKYGKN